LNTLVIYSAAALHTNTVRDYVEAFGRYLPSTVFFEPIEADESIQYSHALDLIDLVIVHYSANFHYGYFGATRLVRRLGEFKGTKVLFTQDDYDFTNKIKDGIAILNPDYVYSVLPDETAKAVYADEIERGIKFVNCLTGYVPKRLRGLKRKPIAERGIDVGYRGRFLPPWYGQLGFEKIGVGVEFRKQAEDTHLKTDIEWETDKRLYGSAWDDFLSNCKTTLASESGCNVFDMDGAIRDEVFQLQRKNPAMTDQEVYEACIAEHEGRYPLTNQISPKMFESVAMGTPLVMFEGSYSGIFEADRHYISLKKDFSNFDEVVSKIHDNEFLQNIADTAYEEILVNPEYSYRHFFQSFWEHISSECEFQDHSAVDLTERIGCKSRFVLGLDRLAETIRIQWWGVGKSVQYLQEWGFKIWIKKVTFLLLRKFKIFAR
jgi:hypothetical protein